MQIQANTNIYYIFLSHRNVTDYMYCSVLPPATTALMSTLEIFPYQKVPPLFHPDGMPLLACPMFVVFFTGALLMTFRLFPVVFSIDRTASNDIDMSCLCRWNWRVNCQKWEIHLSNSIQKESLSTLTSNIGDQTVF